MSGEGVVVDVGLVVVGGKVSMCRSLQGLYPGDARGEQAKTACRLSTRGVVLDREFQKV